MRAALVQPDERGDATGVHEHDAMEIEQQPSVHGLERVELASSRHVDLARAAELAWGAFEIVTGGRYWPTC